MKQQFLHYVLVVIKGMAMGAADVVPGVSGGTVAFVTGIYQELLDSLRSLTPAALMVWYRQGFGAFWRRINGSFLVALLLGIGISVLSLARVVLHCLEMYPIQVWALFFGLILASIFYIAKQIQGWRWQEWLALIIGIAFAVWISLVKPVQMPGEWWMVFLAGAIAICAMILPGISGSFILLLMGMYTVYLKAIMELDWIILGAFLAGCACGLLAFSHLLSWLLKRYHNTTLAVLTGFLAGSLNIVWPWKHTLVTVIDRHGKTVPVVRENLLPMDYAAMTSAPAYTTVAIALMVLGVAIVFLLEWVAVKTRRSTSQSA